MENTEAKLQEPYSLDCDDEAVWHSIAESSHDEPGKGRRAADEDGWRNIATAWEERERVEAAAEVAALKNLVQDVLDHWDSDRWALSPFDGIREWRTKALAVLDPKAHTNAPKPIASLHAGSDLRFAEEFDTPVWL